jgi:hypothetical protein
VDVAQNGIQRKDIILTVSNQWDMLSVCWLHNYVPMNVTNLQSWYLKHPVKISHYRPGQTLRVTAFCGSQISRKLAHEGGKVVSPTHRPPLPPGNIPGTYFC